MLGTKAEHYQLRGNPLIEVPVPMLGNLLYDERGQEVLALHNEGFKGVKNIEDPYDYRRKPITPENPLSFSNVPRILNYQQILRERFPDMHVLSFEEVVRHWVEVYERDTTYADTSGISLYPNQSSHKPNEALRQIVLGIIGKKRIEGPFIVSGLGVKRADNGYGFNFKETDFVEVVSVKGAL